MSQERIERLEGAVEKLCDKLDEVLRALSEHAVLAAVDRTHLGIIKKIVYGLCGIVGTTVVGAVIALVVKQ